MAAVAAIACVAAGVAASQQTPPQFRAIRQLIRFDVTVLDDQRRPVTDLGQSDFELLENGVPREIAAFSRIDVPGPAAAPPWALDAPHDVVENRTDVRRLIVIVIDDAANAFDAAITRRLKDIARRIVRRLGPHDLTAIVFTADNRRPEDFTVDRSRLLRAIDRAGQGWGGAAHPLFSLYSIDTLTKAAEYLTELPEKRKAILYISQGVGGESALPALSGRGQSDRIGTSLSRLLETADRANVSVYAIDPSATSGLSDPARTLQMAYLQVLSLSTGGFAVQPEDLDDGIARVFRAISSYYLIGYSPDAESHGAMRRVEVRVRRPGVTVVSRGVHALPSPEPTVARDPLREAGAALIPVQDLPLRLSTAAFAAPNGGGEASLVVTVRLEPSPVSSAEPATMDVQLSLFDPEGRLQVETRREALASVAGSPFEIAASLPVRTAGQYSLRVAAYDRQRAVAGSVYSMLDVPDFAALPVSVSALAVHVAPPIKSAGSSELEGLLPWRPTTVREFGAGDRVTVLGRIYQDRRAALAPVRVDYRIRDEDNDVVRRGEDVVPVERFAGGGGADWRVELPVSELSPVAYLLEVEARLEDRQAIARQLRFQVHRR